MEVTVGTLVKVGATVAGGMLALSLATSTTIKVIQSVTEAKRKSEAKPCLGCKGKGFYICELCKGNSTIQLSPLFDPIHINLVNARLVMVIAFNGVSTVLVKDTIELQWRSLLQLLQSILAI